MCTLWLKCILRQGLSLLRAHPVKWTCSFSYKNITYSITDVYHCSPKTRNWAQMQQIRGQFRNLYCKFSYTMHFDTKPNCLGESTAIPAPDLFSHSCTPAHCWGSGFVPLCCSQQCTVLVSCVIWQAVGDRAVVLLYIPCRAVPLCRMKRCSTASGGKGCLQSFTQLSISLNDSMMWFGELTADTRHCVRTQQGVPHWLCVLFSCDLMVNAVLLFFRRLHSSIWRCYELQC